MQTFPMYDLGSTGGSQRPVVPVSARCELRPSIVLGGTVGGVAAATDTLTPNALYMADTAAKTQVIAVPPLSTYMEIVAVGDNGTVTVAPVLEFFRCPQSGPSRLWQRQYNTQGGGTTTLSTTASDTTGAAGATRYTLDEGTPGTNIFDVRGAMLIVPRLLTALSGGNWQLYVRFF